MHDVTLVYTEYNHRLEVWVLGKRAANTTADRQQYTNTSKACDDTMSMCGTIWFCGSMVKESSCVKCAQLQVVLELPFVFRSNIRCGVTVQGSGFTLCISQ